MHATLQYVSYSVQHLPSPRHHSLSLTDQWDHRTVCWSYSVRTLIFAGVFCQAGIMSWILR